MLTNALLLEPGESIECLAALRHAHDVRLAVAVDVCAGAKELDGRLDQAGEVECEENEGEDHDDDGEKALLVDEDEGVDYVDDSEGANGDAIRKEPVAKLESVEECDCWFTITRTMECRR